MSRVKQVGLLAAGCQPWNKDVCAASGGRFAYCATLAIYVYELDQRYNEFKLRAIMSEHKKTITAIAWSPHSADVFASASADSLLVVWNVAEQRVVARLDATKGVPASVSWCWNAGDAVAFVSHRGPLYVWTASGADGGVVMHKEAHSFLSDICLFRWHPRKAGKLVFGHTDGSLSIFQPGWKSQKHVLRPESLEGTDEEDPVTALEWDPLSTDYLLAANLHNGIRLVDADSLVCITAFALPGAAASVQCLAWVPSAPGMFVTGDSQVGVLRVWNVSRTTPLEHFKLKKTGFHALHVLSSPPRHKPVPRESPTRGQHTSSTSEAVPPPTWSQSRAFSLPPGHAVCCFMDGGVGLYDMGAKKWDFLRDLGHVETIFDCKFKPDDPSLLATASFDGTVKVWDINSMRAVHTSPGNEGVIYSLSWAPADLNCIAGATSRNGAFIWDIKKGKIITRFNEHGKNGIFCIAWSHKDSKRIATCSADGYCIIRTVDGKVLHRYRHPAAVFGCDWSQNNKDMIATGCEDRSVRVYYLATSSEQPLKVFTGHTAKVFHVRWSPLREGILCSGSDDGTVRIWDYTQDACISVLAGHQAPVRGLMWSPEVPYLLASGSWDYSIRVWDTRDSTCLDTVADHGADVYGLTCHPSRPFTMASCSRDSTVRLWSLAPLVSPLMISILAERPWDEIIGNTERVMSPGAPPLLCGKASKDIRQEVEKLGGDAHAKKLRWFSEFFSPPGGSRNLWDLVAVLRGQDDGTLPPDYAKGIMHMRHLVKYKTSEAQELTTVKMSKFGGGIGAPSKDERLQEAAQIHLRLGQIQRYCELMVELGEWDKALSVAPGVSMSYWKKLMQRRADQLVEEEDDAVIPCCVATGDVRKLVHFFCSRGQLADAVLLAQAACEGNILEAVIPSEPRSPGDAAPSSESHAGLLRRVSGELAEWYFRDGQAIMAACCHLAIDEVELAVSKLVRGNELELAVTVGVVLGGAAAPIAHQAAQLLARKCLAFNRWDLAVDLLKMIPDSEEQLVQLCAFSTGSSTELDELHRKCELPTLEECAALAESHAEAGEVEPAVRHALLSPTPERALEIGLPAVKERMSREGWTLEEVLPLLKLLGSIQTDRLMLHRCSDMRNELLILCGYAGALWAMRRGYWPVVPALYEYTSQLLRRRDVSVPLHVDELARELDAWRHAGSPGTTSAAATPAAAAAAAHDSASPEQLALFADLERRVGSEELAALVGYDHVTGSSLPSHADLQLSCLTGAGIQGPVFFLEDGKSAISLNDALMWAKVNPFSPLGTGLPIIPF